MDTSYLLGVQSANLTMEGGSSGVVTEDKNRTLDMIRNHIQSVYTHLDGVEEEHQVRLKNELDRVHNEFQTQLANIRSQNDAKISDLMKEIHNLKRSLETETARRRSGDEYMRNFLKGQSDADNILSAAFKAWSDAKKSSKPVRQSRWNDLEENTNAAKRVKRDPCTSEQAAASLTLPLETT